MNPISPAKSNYLVGNDPKKWVSGAAHYARVRQAGVDPKRIRRRFSG